MTINLELSEAELRLRRNVKWATYAKDVLPAWIAEMDFAIAEPVQSIIERVARQQDYGYAMRGDGEPDEALAHVFCQRMNDRHGWRPAPQSVQFIAAFDQAILALLFAFTDQGDGIIVQTPCYPPFYQVMEAAGRRMIKNPLLPGEARAEIDFDHLAEVAAQARVLLLCNPQNPSGRVFSEGELQRIVSIALQHDLLVICDEIHSDIVYQPYKHIPLASLGDEIADRTVTLNSASKGFNLAGLYCGVMCFGSLELAARYHARMPRMLMGQPNVMGLDATIAAWTDGEAWATAMLALLTARRDQMLSRLRMITPRIAIYEPQGSYLAWLDFSALRLQKTAHAFLLEKAGVATMPGQRFDPAGGNFVRLNFATSEAILERILDRIEAAVSQHCKS